MGAAACQCEAVKPDEAVKFTPRVQDAVREEKAPMGAPNALLSALPPQLQKLQGFWQTESDKQIMGEIVGANLIWDQQFNYNQSPLRVVGNSIEMELMGDIHKATYEENRLRWSDGDLWVRAT
mmetsp:Transcript_5583/g.9967  ORF Transcript_5583/g.9967 Transcript_5583/m.9967 type:complete len:123 (+) Transcript_5583:63-431(+)|eukprot:CAMPEP_0197658248 /NCGR_PEP_ID=MMETSP1338-20131121/45126_1 /TAXON_ID=43686 ORGANISM="Pelagodinium beii, Strain RCC1491" /NCGR_SAMPLE_ID=MMETSP1338 /ASSEMBLY_ACC=CAM_ASM_000754 /LENGTH=122 /DNA_ID=CAMNT_0043234801 /DNA_START=35 /DNA_END=403 /DNA_ORIENTATION=-